MAKELVVDLHKLSGKEIDKLRELRWRARTDLMWFGKYVLGKDKLKESLNRPLINHLQQFPTPSTSQFYENDKFTTKGWEYKPIISVDDMGDLLPGKRRRLIIDPRSSYKTTINCECHTLQWLINYPSICLAIFQYKLEKAESILSSIKQHFLINDVFRSLFPELVPPDPTKDFGTKDKFNIYNVDRWRTTSRRESSVMAAALSAGLAGYHFEVMKFSDCVDPENTENEEQCWKTIHKYGQSEYLLVNKSKHWIDMEGTRYSYCFKQDTKITMSDFSQKEIKDIVPGDMVVGWDTFENSDRRKLTPTKVLAAGSLLANTNKYTFSSGQEIICTPEHKWWKGPKWRRGGPNQSEYGTLQNMETLHRVFIPRTKDESNVSGWLAGIFDGEGSVSIKNNGWPSGDINITQAGSNSTVLERLRDTLTSLKFNWSENIYKIESEKNKVQNFAHKFAILDGWQGRYKFLTEIRPARQTKIINSLYGQLKTFKEKLIKTEPYGKIPVYWIQTETGNYLAEGFCSKNSDLYGHQIRNWKQDCADNGPENSIWSVYTRGVFRVKENLDEMRYEPDELDMEPIIDPVTKKRITIDSDLYPLHNMEYDEKVDPTNFWAQMCNKPLAGRGGIPDFILTTDEKTGEKLPRTITPSHLFKNLSMAYTVISVDPAETTNERSNYTAIVVASVDRHGRTYIHNIIHGKWNPTDVAKQIIKACDKYRPEYLCLEEVSATRNLMPGIAREWDLFPKLHWKPTVRFNKRDVKLKKEEKIRLNLHTPYHLGDLRFVRDLIDRNGWENLVLELNEFPKSGQDDILDALSEIYASREWFGQEWAKKLGDNSRKIVKLTEEEFQDFREKLFNDMIGEKDLFASDYSDDMYKPLNPQTLRPYDDKLGGL